MTKDSRAARLALLWYASLTAVLQNQPFDEVLAKIEEHGISGEDGAAILHVAGEMIKLFDRTVAQLMFPRNPQVQ